jgi:hypothetical protein
MIDTSQPTGLPRSQGSTPTTRRADEFKCSRCKSPKRQAVVFVGLADPDGTQYPMCSRHEAEWQMEVFEALSNLK